MSESDFYRPVLKLTRALASSIRLRRGYPLSGGVEIQLGEYAWNPETIAAE
jgi:hypothetical protein